jgi:hypothetical protein
MSRAIPTSSSSVGLSGSSGDGKGSRERIHGSPGQIPGGLAVGSGRGGAGEATRWSAGSPPGGMVSPSPPRIRIMLI